jgi:hypothetical protein
MLRQLPSRARSLANVACAPQDIVGESRRKFLSGIENTTKSRTGRGTNAARGARSIDSGRRASAFLDPAGDVRQRLVDLVDQDQ